jgi:hypothetical protein
MRLPGAIPVIQGINLFSCRGGLLNLLIDLSCLLDPRIRYGEGYRECCARCNIGAKPLRSCGRVMIVLLVGKIFSLLAPMIPSDQIRRPLTSSARYLLGTDDFGR